MEIVGRHENGSVIESTRSCLTNKTKKTYVHTCDLTHGHNVRSQFFALMTKFSKNKTNNGMPPLFHDLHRGCLVACTTLTSEASP